MEENVQRSTLNAQRPTVNVPTPNAAGQGAATPRRRLGNAAAGKLLRNFSDDLAVAGWR
jgi:hypothetical protein